MRRWLGLALMAVSLGCSSTGPTAHTDFVVAVGRETFIVRATDPVYCPWGAHVLSVRP